MEIPVKRFHSFRFQKDGKLECELIRSRVENSCKSLQCGVFPSGHLVTFSDAVSIVEEASIYTQLFFSANGDNIRPSQAKTIKSPELAASEKEVLCTCDSENTSQGIKTKMCLIFLLHAVQTPCFGHQNCSKELFSTIVFRFFDSRAYINYTENFMVFSTLTPSSHDQLRTRLRTFLRLRT